MFFTFPFPSIVSALFEYLIHPWQTGKREKDLLSSASSHTQKVYVFITELWEANEIRSNYNDGMVVMFDDVLFSFFQAKGKARSETSLEWSVSIPSKKDVRWESCLEKEMKEETASVHPFESHCKEHHWHLPLSAYFIHSCPWTLVPLHVFPTPFFSWKSHLIESRTIWSVK